MAQEVGLYVIMERLSAFHGLFFIVSSVRLFVVVLLFGFAFIYVQAHVWKPRFNARCGRGSGECGLGERFKYLVECYRCPGLEAAAMDSLFDFLAQFPVPLSSNLSHLMAKYNAPATPGGHVDSTHFECTAVSSRS